MTLLITYLFIAIGVSFICSILEAVLLSITPGYVESQLAEKPRRTKALKQVREDLDESISSILILNTFAHTMGAAGVGAQATRVFGTEWESLIAFLLTLAILYFSEIIPKTLGATYWKRLALPAAYIIQLLVKLLFPFVWVSARLTRLFGKGEGAAISREELAAMARLGGQDGALGNQEQQLVENILSLRECTTEQILTPRTVVSALDSKQTVREAATALKNIPFTRIPVYEGDLDSVLGLVFKTMVFEALNEGKGDQLLQEYLVPVHRVEEALPVLQLLDLFLKRREHQFVVEDHFGQTAGIVTLEDALETLLGREIMDESDTVEDMQRLARANYRRRLRGDRAS